MYIIPEANAQYKMIFKTLNMYKFRLKFCLSLFFLSYLSPVKPDEDCVKTNHSPVKELKNHLFCDYDKTVRPKLDRSNATKVDVKMVLKSVHYSMHGSSLGVNSWLVVMWTDDHLKWELAEHDGIEFIKVASDELWVPDFSVYNRANQGGHPGALTSINCILNSKGLVICISPGSHDAICQADLTRFPFDVQNCTIRYGSWLHSGEEINFTLAKPPVSLDDYVEKGDWRLDSVDVTKHPGHYNCCLPSTFPSLNYNFIVSRHSGVYVCLAITPAIGMLIMTMVSLCLDPLEAERFTVIVCNILGHTLFLQFLFWELPVTGPEPALIVIYAKDSYILAIFVLVVTMVERKLIKMKSPSPIWLSMTVAGVVNSRPGQVIFDDSLKNVGNILGDDDTVNIVENLKKQRNKDWIIFAKILDRLCFILYAFIFMIMIIRFMP